MLVRYEVLMRRGFDLSDGLIGGSSWDPVSLHSLVETDLGKRKGNNIGNNSCTFDTTSSRNPHSMKRQLNGQPHD